MSVEEREVVAVRTVPVDGHEHVAEVRLRGGRREPASDVMAAIQRHEAHYFMHQGGARLLVRVAQCPDCAWTVLVA